MRVPSNCPLFYVSGFGITNVVAEKIEKVKKTKTGKKSAKPVKLLENQKCFLCV